MNFLHIIEEWIIVLIAVTIFVVVVTDMAGRLRVLDFNLLYPLRGIKVGDLNANRIISKKDFLRNKKEDITGPMM